MKHTLIITVAALAVSACTCTCPEKKYDFQPVQSYYQETQPSYQTVQSQRVEFLPPSHMMEYVPVGRIESQATIKYRRYTQISYTQPQQPEVIYYPVYQPVTQPPKYQENCSCRQYQDCCC